MKPTQYNRALVALALALSFSASAVAQTGQLVAGRTDTGVTKNLRVDSSGNQYIVGSGASGAVFGPTATGVAPSQPPVYSAGIDGGGLTRGLLTDTSGRLSVVGQTGASALQMQGAAATGTALAGNPVLVGGSTGTNAVNLSVNASGQLNVIGPLVDAASGNGTGLLTGLYNTSTVHFENLRALPGLTTAGTGLLASGLASVYNSTLPTYTTGQYGALQMNIKGALYAQLIDGNGSSVATTTAGSDGATNALPGLNTYSRQTLYNGATWDSQRTANGAAATTGTGLAGAGQLGFDGTNWQKTTVDSKGAQFVNTESQKASYSTSYTVTTTAGGVVLMLQGSASKTVKITAIDVNCGAAAANNSLISLAITSSTPGAGTGQTAYKLDSGTSAATAVPTAFTGATAGTLVSQIYNGNMFCGTSTVASTNYVYRTAPNSAEITLRGTSQYLQFYQNFAVGSVLYVNVTWTEE
jgi:hypothetical protein